MYKVLKYPIQLTDVQTLRTQYVRRVMHVDVQHGALTLWAECEKHDRDYDVPVYVIGTGQDIPYDAYYAGTVLVDMFVWHVYIGQMKRVYDVHTISNEPDEQFTPHHSALNPQTRYAQDGSGVMTGRRFNSGVVDSQAMRDKAATLQMPPGERYAIDKAELTAREQLVALDISEVLKTAAPQLAGEDDVTLRTKAEADEYFKNFERAVNVDPTTQAIIRTYVDPSKPQQRWNFKAKCWEDVPDGPKTDTGA